MNITKFEANQTMMMSSREIASLTGSSHDNVLKTIRSLVKQGVVSVNETTYIHEQNKQEYVMYLLDYRDTMVVVSGYSVELRARIIDRWQEFENQVKQPKLPTTYLEALKALPDEYGNTPTAVAKILGLKPNLFIETLSNA